MYSRSFIESHTVYVADGGMTCADCAAEKIAELKDRREREEKRALRFIDEAKPDAAADAARNAARAEADRNAIFESATLDDGEADAPRSCDECHAHIDGALTPDGARYVAGAIVDYVRGIGGARDVVVEWAETYFDGADVSTILAHPETDLPRILKRFRAVDRERRALERDRSAVLGRRYRMVSDAAARLRDAWVRFAYGSDDVRATLRPSLRARR